MSADPNAPADPIEPGPDTSGVLPVEVVVEGAPPAAPAAGDDDPRARRIAELEAQLATVEQERKDSWDRYLRAAADLENLRKRQRRELDDARHEVRGKVLKEMLPVVDNLERAIDHAGAPGAAQAGTSAILEGVQLVLRQFYSAFERLEVSVVEAMGHPFDPNVHEAISQQESDATPGTIVQVLQRGYRAGDRLLRPALVVVAKARA